MEYGESAEDQTDVTYQDYLFGGKEFDRKFELNLYDSGARFYDATRNQWTTMDPLAETHPEISPYAFCANNPVNLIDPDGMDWYQWQDDNGNQATFWQDGDAKTVDYNGQTYNNIGTTYTHDIGGGTSITYTQNEATSMTFTGIDGSSFVAQGTGTGCKIASDQMLANGGVNSNGERINVVNADANGVATTATSNATRGINAVDNALENGNPIEVGVDYKPRQVNNIPPNGDGMTDHFIVVSSKTETLSNGQVTSKTYNFFDPRKAQYGTSPSNTLHISNNQLVGAYRGERVIPYTVTTVRTSR